MSLTSLLFSFFFREFADFCRSPPATIGVAHPAFAQANEIPKVSFAIQSLASVVSLIFGEELNAFMEPTSARLAEENNDPEYVTDDDNDVVEVDELLPSANEIATGTRLTSVQPLSDCDSSGGFNCQASLCVNNSKDQCRKDDLSRSQGGAEAEIISEKFDGDKTFKLSNPESERKETISSFSSSEQNQFTPSPIFPKVLGSPDLDFATISSTGNKSVSLVSTNTIRPISSPCPPIATSLHPSGFDYAVPSSIALSQLEEEKENSLRRAQTATMIARKRRRIELERDILRKDLELLELEAMGV